MFDQENQALPDAAGTLDTPVQNGAAPAVEEAPGAVGQPAGNPTSTPVENAGVPAETPGGEHPLSQRHAAAGRKGAHRVHQLIQQGQLYEREHGLKRGRQRLRQLIEEGKLYEQEHGLRPARKAGGRRLSRAGREKLLLTFFEALVRMSKPTFRGKLRQVLEQLEAGTN